MNSGKLFGYGLACVFLMALAKLALYRFLNSESLLITLLVYVFVIFCTIAFVRRLGIINYLESIVVMFFWLIFSLVVDFFVIAPLAGLKPYTTASFWLLYPFFVLCIFLLHKKRHIDIRKGGTGK